MLRIKVNDPETGKEVNLSYTFRHHSDGEFKNANPNESRRYMTDCHLVVDDYPDFYYIGTAINSSKDQWVRKIGMVISFSRALTLAFPDNRELRKVVFKKFWENHGRRIYKNRLARVV